MSVSFQVTPIYKCALVREGSVRTQPQANSSLRAREVAAELLKNSPCEQFIVIILNAKLRVIGVSVVTTGTLDASLVHPREALRPVILANGSSFIVAHNHPSGILEPSREDWQVFESIRSAGKLMGIDCLDSIIVNDEGDSVSMVEMRAER